MRNQRPNSWLQFLVQFVAVTGAVGFMSFTGACAAFGVLMKIPFRTKTNR